MAPEAAYGATAFGAFFVTGMQAKGLGFESAGEFARFVSQSGINQFEVMYLFSERTGIVERLQGQDWQGFMRRWNGLNPRAVERLTEFYKREVKRLNTVDPWLPVEWK